MILKTERLTLRRFQPTDIEAMAVINADARVMEHFPSTLTIGQTSAHLLRVQRHWDEYGFGLFALEVRDTGQMIGFTGLTHPPYETPFTPCVEIGWRLTPEAWGNGYAFEAARACLKWGFNGLDFPEIVSFTFIGNTRSTRLMRRLGMRHNAADDFDHPMLSPDSPLLRHVLYRLRRSDWKQTS